MDKLLLSYSTFSKLSLLTVIGWSALGSVLTARFLHMHNSEPSSDFRCDVKYKIDKDFIRAKCFDQYQKQNNKQGVPLYAFIIVNVWVIPVVSVIYSQCVKSIVEELERRHQDAERRRSCRLFLAYFCQLAVSFALRIIFIVFLETELFYPKTFPANFTCSIEGIWGQFLQNKTKSADSVPCFTQRAADKDFWIETVKYANGFFALVALLEILWILSRARKGNWHFYVDHLKSNPEEHHQVQPEAMPLVLVEPQHRAVNTPRVQRNAEITYPGHPELVQAPNDFSSAIQTLKEDCLRYTQQLSDLKQPFRRRNPGEGSIHDLKMDEIYVNVAIHEGRAHHYFREDQGRWAYLKEFPPNAEDCYFAKPEDIIDKEHTNVLVVGRPGIGKTSLCTKMLRLWANDQAFNEDHNDKSTHFNVVFLVKFRHFNDKAELSLRELLARAETVQSLDDPVWEFINKQSTKVLLIFDGVDEYSRKENLNAQEDDDRTYKNDVEEKMPVSVLYNKLAAGELLRGASILTTTRPTAVKYVAHVNFQRTVEIRGFTTENVEDYVEKFTRGVPGAKEKMLGHIKSNLNLLSLCYIPMNCFLICHCLLQIILYKPSQALPTKITDIYKMTVKMFFFNHNREGCSQKELEKLKSTHMYKPFEEFPKELQEIFKSLGEIAFKGIKEARLLFESSEVSGLEDCGLLHKLPDEQPPPLSDKEPKSQFCFTHLTVQEFFAAKHLVDTKTDEGIEEFVSKYINDGTWQVVLQFVAGLLKSSSSDIFIKLLPISTEERTSDQFSVPEILTFWPGTREEEHQAVQVCKCLHEINDEQQKEAQNKLEEISFNTLNLFDHVLTPIDVADIFHFLENAEEIFYINLSFNHFGDLGTKEVKKFIVNRERKLKRLVLIKNNLTDQAAKYLAATLTHSNCQLTWLDLSLNKFTDEAAEDFAAALKHSNCKLESLYLRSNNYFTDRAAKDFAAALEHSNCKLKKLWVTSDNFTKEGHQYLTDAGKHINCEVFIGQY